MSRFLPLGNAAEFINGYAFDPTDWHGEGLPIIRIQNLTDHRKPFNFTTSKVPEKFHVKPGELLVSWSASLGVFEWRGPEVGLVNQHIFRVKPNESVVYPNYLRHALEGALEDMKRHLHGATMQHVNRGEFLATPVFLPSLAEQRRIAAILDQADALRAKRRAALALLDEMAQAIFVDMFGDPARNPKNWVIGRIGDLLSSATYGTSAKADLSGNYPVLRMNNLTSAGRLDLRDLKRTKLATPKEVERYTVQSGDILFNRTNSPELVGKTAVYHGKDVYAYAGYLVRLRTNELAEPEFISAYLNSSHGKATLRSMCKTIIGMANINAKEVQGIRIYLPPRELQSKFSQFQKGLTALRDTLLRSLILTDELFASLQHRAFRGDL